MTKSNVHGASVFLTGGTGSFGKAFTHYALKNLDLKRLVVFSRDELKQYEMQSELRSMYDAETLKCMRFFIGDVRDGERVEVAMRGCTHVVHAAALKHVPIAEYNPMECVKTNINGAENIVRAAINNSVHKVIALSTDKACNPINLYGATKLASDKIFVAANNIVGDDRPTRFSVVRYGNVIGSRGSVVPFFRRLAEQKATLPVTDDRMTRFWITLEAGVDFVMSNFDIMQGGEIFVPKIPSVNIMALANVIGEGLPTKVVGIRPGEKLHEVMISEDDAWVTVEIEDRYAIEPSHAEFPRKSLIESLGAKKVSDRFYYASDVNHDILDKDQLRALLEKAKV